MRSSWGSHPASAILDRIRSFGRVVLLLLASLLASSCGLQEVPDWEWFYARQPRSILVLPVENETTEVEAPRFFMATIAHALIARGYYVYPVEATSEILASEGFTSGAEMRSVNPARFRQFLGTDGVLFVTIKSWDTVYVVISSSVTVTLEYLLLDTRTGDTVWTGTWTVEKRSGGGGSGNLIADLIVAAIDAAVTAALTDYVPLARQANALAFQNLAPGEYHPEYTPARERNLAAWHEYQKAKAEQGAAE